MLSPAARRMQAQDKAKNRNKKNAEGDLAIWESLGIHCSANERRADEASRDVEAWLKCYFIRDKLGEEFTGTISGVATFGIFVQLDALYIEGLVHVSELGADYFQYDEARHELRGERTGIRYQLTDRVTVQVSRVDLDARKIDLRLVNAPGIRTMLKNEARRADAEQQAREQKSRARAASGPEPAEQGKIIGPSFSAHQMPTVVERILEVYVRERIEDERFIDTAHRIGVVPFKEHVYATPIGAEQNVGEPAYA
jgi:ribonuclease R